MSRLDGLYELEAGLSASDLLRLLITQRHPGQVGVTASLKARSVAVLAMIAEIDPTVPVTFCHASSLYPESAAYRDALVQALGLTNVNSISGRATMDLDRVPGDSDCYECLWVDAKIGERWADGGKVRELVYVTKALADKECWISAVYHLPRLNQHRLDPVGGRLRVDPVLDWSDEDVRAFLKARDLPLHPRAQHHVIDVEPADLGEAPAIYCY